MARSKRIQFLASLAKGYDTVLDIGTDHGFVLQEAFDQGWIKKGIAADINEGPLNQAKENLKGYPVTFVLSDGFQSIKDTYDLAIIAGMGAYTIGEIMNHASHDEAIYLLQANDKQEILRDYLNTHGFQIIDEYIVDDGFYYVIMMVKKGEMKLSPRDIYLGPILKEKPEAKAYYKRKLYTLENIVNQADEDKKSSLEVLIGYLKSVL